MFPLFASLPYFIFFFLFTILLFFKNIKNTQQWLNIIFLSMVLILFFYKGEYSDWRTYISYANSCNCLGCTYFEFGYDFLTFIAFQTIGFYLIPIVSLSLQYIALTKFKRLVQTKIQYVILIFSIFLVFLPLYYGALRQSISFSLILLGYIYFYQNKYFIAVLISFIAISFHLSAIIIIFFYLLYYLFFKLLNTNKFIIFTILSYFIGIYLMNMIFDYIKIIESFNLGMLNTGIDSTGLKAYLLPIERIIILIMSFYLLIKTNYQDKFFHNVILFGIIGAIFYLVVYKFSLNTAGRTVAFFRMADIYIIYYFFKNILQKNTISIFLNETINNIGILSIIFYTLLKYYFTIISVGFFR